MLAQISAECPLFASKIAVDRRPLIHGRSIVIRNSCAQSVIGKTMNFKLPCSTTGSIKPWDDEYMSKEKLIKMRRTVKIKVHLVIVNWLRRIIPYWRPLRLILYLSLSLTAVFAISLFSIISVTFVSNPCDNIRELSLSYPWQGTRRKSRIECRAIIINHVFREWKVFCILRGTGSRDIRNWISYKLAQKSNIPKIFFTCICMNYNINGTAIILRKPKLKLNSMFEIM